jgi:hypothetical protein
MPIAAATAMAPPIRSRPNLRLFFAGLSESRAAAPLSSPAAFMTSSVTVRDVAALRGPSAWILA